MTLPVPTVREIVTLYLRHCALEGRHSPEARRIREAALGDFVGSCGHHPASECRPYHLTDWVEAHPTWRSVSTRRSRANAVRAVFQWAVDQERIDRNPFKAVRYAEADRRPELPDAILEQIAFLGNKPFERAVRFLRLTGCRLAELCEAEWPHLDLERGVWTIPRHKSRRYTGQPKVVALVPEAVALLRGLSTSKVGEGPMTETEAVVPVAQPMQPVGAGATYVFLNTRGKPWNRRTLGQQLRRMKARHGIKTAATLHGIRHRMATEAIANGAPLKLVAEQLGHTTTAITERYYFHRSEEQLEAIRAAVAKGLPKGPQTFK